MQFRQAQTPDIGQIVDIYGQAVRYFADHGIDQWQHGYPSAASAEEDVAVGRLYLLEEDGVALATAVFQTDPEPTYAAIYQGNWAHGGAYAAVHRVAVRDDCKGRGLAQRLFDEFTEMGRRSGFLSLRIDTHQQNRSMQRALTKNGFEHRGTIYLPDGSPRMAFEKMLLSGSGRKPDQSGYNSPAAR